ncbi:MAG: hypothetical protein NVS2B7_32140 [Herpetosiphon sp.]
MLQRIVEALGAREELTGWRVRDIRRDETQLYSVFEATEARRRVSDQRYVVQVMCTTNGAADAPTMGMANATVLPGDDVDAAIARAVFNARHVHNRPSPPVEAAALPDVPIADPAFRNDVLVPLEQLLARLRARVAQVPGVRLSAAELYAVRESERLITSTGIDAEQVGTDLHCEWVVLAKQGDREGEAFTELSRRRFTDVPLQAVVGASARSALAALEAGPPPRWEGAVVLRDEVLRTVLVADVFQTLGSAAMKYRATSPWEIGQAVVQTGSGDPLTVYATRTLPWGTRSNRFDQEGLPARRVPLIQNNRLQTFVADQRHAAYLGLTPTGAFGNIEIEAGQVPGSELLHDPYVEVTAFSWFMPESISGEFSAEIRLGYIVEGDRRTPFRGGALTGNLLDALAHARWSKETGLYGDYQGPQIARFGDLRIDG